jgi:hypothetical protein
MNNSFQQDNYDRAGEHNVELIAPTMGPAQDNDLNLANLRLSEKGQIIACPQGNAPGKVKKRKRVSIGFNIQGYENCPNLAQCLVKKVQRYYYLRYSDKQVRLEKRRIYEQPGQFKDRYRWRPGF